MNLLSNFPTYYKTCFQHQIFQKKGNILVLKLLNLLVSGVLKSVSHEEIKGEQLTYEKAKEYLNGPLEKFAAKPLKTVSSGKKEMEDTSKLGKNLLQQHLQ